MPTPMTVPELHDLRGLLSKLRLTMTRDDGSVYGGQDIDAVDTLATILHDANMLVLHSVQSTTGCDCDDSQDVERYRRVARGPRLTDQRDIIPQMPAVSPATHDNDPGGDLGSTQAREIREHAAPGSSDPWRPPAAMPASVRRSTPPITTYRESRTHCAGDRRFAPVLAFTGGPDATTEAHESTRSAEAEADHTRQHAIGESMRLFERSPAQEITAAGARSDHLPDHLITDVGPADVVLTTKQLELLAHADIDREGSQARTYPAAAQQGWLHVRRAQCANELSAEDIHTAPQLADDDARACTAAEQLARWQIANCAAEATLRASGLALSETRHIR